MRKMIFLLGLFIFRVSALEAAPVGSPAGLLKKGQWDFAVEGGYISRRPMESSGSGDYEASIIHGYHSRSYGLNERLMLTARAGGMYGYIYDQTTSGQEVKTSLSGGLGLGLQLKGIIFKHGRSGFEWNGAAQYLYLRSHHKSSGKANADWYEWQLSSCLAKKLGAFKPYAGLKFSSVNLDRDDGKGNKTSYEEDGSISPFVGTDIYLGQDKALIINLEAGFAAGNDYYGGIKYRF